MEYLNKLDKVTPILKDCDRYGQYIIEDRKSRKKEEVQRAFGKGEPGASKLLKKLLVLVGGEE